MAIEFKEIIFLTGALHFTQLPSMLMAPRMLGWRDDLSKLTPINQWIFRVIAGGIMLTVMGTGCVSMFSAQEISSGGRLATGFSGFMAIFWAYRSSVQVFLYTRIWPGGSLGRLSHWGLSFLFVSFFVVYSTAFFRSL